MNDKVCFIAEMIFNLNWRPWLSLFSGWEIYYRLHDSSHHMLNSAKANVLALASEEVDLSISLPLRIIYPKIDVWFCLLMKEWYPELSISLKLLQLQYGKETGSMNKNLSQKSVTQWSQNPWLYELLSRYMNTP